MSNILSLLVASLISVSLYAQNAPVTVLQLPPGLDNPRNSEGDFMTLKDGRILFLYSRFYGDSRSDFGSSSLAARYSSDGGETWTSEDDILIKNEGAMNVMSVSLLRLQNDDIALFYARKNSMHDCIPMMRISTDEARTWSAPTPCITDKEGYFVLNNDRVIQLGSGRLLMPVSQHVTPREKKKFNENGIMYCYYSDDQGRTWQSTDSLQNPTNFMTQEPGVIELKDGTIMMFVRSNAGRQLISHSSDRGESWTPLALSNIISPLSPASIKRIPSTGDLLLIWNHNDGSDPRIAGKRTPFNAAISRNEGKTWENIKTLADDIDTRYCYTAISFSNNHVLLGHVAGLYSDGTRNAITKVTRIALNWLYNESSGSNEKK